MNGTNSSIFTPLVCDTLVPTTVSTVWKKETQQLPETFVRERDDLWQQLLQSESYKRGQLFNSKLARLVEFSHSQGRLSLTLGETDYKTLMYSNRNIERIVATWGESFLSRALGISAVVISSDQQVILMKRSPFVGEFPNSYDVFGGHVEPVTFENTQHPDVFAAIGLELEQELSLYSNEYKLTCIGLFESTANRKPELVFDAASKLCSAELLQRSRRATSRDEYVEIYAIENNQASILDYMKKKKTTISPSAYGCLWLHTRQQWA